MTDQSELIEKWCESVRQEEHSGEVGCPICGSDALFHRSEDTPRYSAPAVATDAFGDPMPGAWDD